MKKICLSKTCHMKKRNSETGCFSLVLSRIHVAMEKMFFPNKKEVQTEVPSGCTAQREAEIGSEWVNKNELVF